MTGKVTVIFPGFPGAVGPLDIVASTLLVTVSENSPKWHGPDFHICELEFFYVVTSAVVADVSISLIIRIETY